MVEKCSFLAVVGVLYEEIYVLGLFLVLFGWFYKFWEAAENSISRVGVFVCASLPRRNRLLSTEESIHIFLIIVVDMLHIRPIILSLSVLKHMRFPSWNI